MIINIINIDKYNSIHCFLMHFRDLIKNMLIGYFNSSMNKQKEILDLICKMLNFNIDELKQVLICYFAC